MKNKDEKDVMILFRNKEDIVVISNILKENCQHRILFPTQMSFKNKGKIHFLTHKTERIHPLTYTTRHVKGNPSNKRKMTPDENVKSPRNGRYLGKYKRIML